HRAVARRHAGGRLLPPLHHDPARDGGEAVRRRQAEHLPADLLRHARPRLSGPVALGAADGGHRVLLPDRCGDGGGRPAVHDARVSLAAAAAGGPGDMIAMVLASGGEGGRRSPGMRTVALAVLALILAGPRLPAASAAPTAREILDQRKALDDTTRKWTDRQEHLKLIIKDARGGERERALMLYERRLPSDERQTIVFFVSPAEGKGTGFHTYTYKGRPADQWLYLPELKRIRQITPRSRTESFVGTDLSYQDLDIIQEMSSWSEADARSSLRGEETVDGVPTYVIEL